MAVFKKVELVGTSPTSIEDAVGGAIATASESVRDIGWFEVREIRGRVADGAVTEYQVVIAAGFKIDSD